MSLSVKNIADEVAALANLPQLGQYFGNATRNAQVVVNAIKDAARDVARSYNWTILTIRTSFSVTSATDTYDLPSDFDRFIPESMWDSTNNLMVRGPMSVQQFETLNSGSPSTGGYLEYFFKIQPKSGTPTTQQVVFYPAPTASVVVNYSYITKKIYMSGGTTPATAISSDDDTFVIDDEVVKLGATWRIMAKLGLNYVDSKIDYQMMLQERQARDGGSKVLNMEGEGLRAYIGAANIPQTGFGQ